MANYELMLLDALLHPSSLVWNGPPRAVASLQATSHPTVSAIAVGVGDGAERRVDAVVHSPDREWSVPFFVDEKTSAVSKLWVYERPGACHTESGLVIVVNGTSGVGKSALLEALLEEATTPWIVFDEPHVGRVPTEYLIWRDAAPSLHRAAFIAMRSLAESGIQVAISAGGFDQQTICESLRGVPVRLVALRCSEESLGKRLAVEPHKRPIASLDRTVADVHTGWTYDLELDTDGATPHQLAAQVIELATRRRVAATRPSQSCRRDSATLAIAQKSFRRA